MQVENIESIYELSPMQQGMLFHSLHSPQSGMYVEQLTCILRGPLDVAGFRQAWQQVVNRHAVLRTSFYWKEMDKPLQVVQRAAPLPLDVQDWRELPRDTQRRQFADLLETDRRRGFELAQAPLMRLVLLRIGEHEYQLLWSHHHLLLDGWCLSLLLGQVFAAYQAFSERQPFSLPPAHPFKEYIAWLQQQDMSKAERYWRRTLSGFAGATPLPGVRSTTTVPRDAITQTAQQRLCREQTVRLQSFARQHQLTLNSVAQAAWGLLLSRYSGEKDVVFGAVVSGRPAKLPGVETMVGLFINTLPVRLQLRGEAQTLAWLRQFQQQQVEQREYEYSPLAQVQSWSHVASGSPLFESLVVFENYPLDETTLSQTGSLDITDVRSYEMTNYPLTVVIKPGEELLLEIKYDGARFDDSAIKRVLRHYLNLMQSIASHPDCSLSGLSLMDEEEKRQVLDEWNPTTRYPITQTLHELFAEQASRRPDAVAVTSGSQQVSYGELNRRANQLGNYLRKRGVKAEAVVGVMVERSAEMIVSLLGVMKAGGAYLPIDLGSPWERVKGMLEDADVKVVVVQGKASERMKGEMEEAGMKVVEMEEERREVEREEEREVMSEAAAENLAYVIYTSGSTGRPKGVAVTHANVGRLFAATAEKFGFSEREVWSVFHGLAFDFSVWEMWGGLMYGGRLVVVSEGERRAPERWYELVEKERVTVMNQTPTAFYQWAREEEERGGGRELGLRVVILGGEELEVSKLKGWMERRGEERVEIVNMYGITETTVHVSYHRVREEEVRRGKRGLIGVGVGDMRMMIMDEKQEGVGVGMRGEICVAGGGLGRGYVGRGGETGRVYVPNPYGKEEGERMYRSGDEGRREEEGEVRYEGRRDGQVKVRGYRVEVGEVERAMMEEEGVREVVVVRREDEAGDARLVAYVIFRPNQVVAIHELRARLQAKLPTHMMPAAIVPVEQFPLTANGKLDRRALPDPALTTPVMEGPFAAPGNLVEEQLAGIFADVLRVERVSIDDSFFDLGGDSIRSIQVRAQGLKAGLDISIQQLFENPTIRALAQKILTTQDETARSLKTAPFELISEAERRRLPDDVEDAYPLTALQEGMLFHTAYSRDSLVYHDVFSFHLKCAFDAGAFETAVRLVTARHAVLRTSFDLIRFSEPLQLVHRDASIPLHTDDIRRLSEAEQEATLDQWIAAEKNARIDWSCAPLLRLQIHRRSDEAFQLSISFHHAIFDGWSLASFLTELFKLYLSLPDGAALGAPPPRATFRDFVALERAALRSEPARRYWQEKLADFEPVNLARRSATAAGNQSTPVSSLEMRIAPEMVTAVKRFARAAAVPLKSVLLAAHLRVMSLLSGRADVVTGVVSNGRPEDDEGEQALGLFLNTLPVRLVLTGGRWIDLAQQALAAEREWLPFRRFPLAALQQLLGGQPLFETAFNFTHFHVYNSLEGKAGVELLGARSFEETNFTLLANFSLGNSSAIQLGLEYKTAELSDEQARAIGDYYINVLRAMIDAPQSRYETAALLPASERRRLLVEYNDTAKPERNGSLLKLFEGQVRRIPDGVAVEFGALHLSYEALNRRANHLAHYLKNYGVGRESRIGLAMERSVEAMVALLGVLKAGAAYVPLDPAYPQERLAAMIEDAAPVILLTQERLLAAFRAGDANVVCLDADWPSVMQARGDDPAPETQDDNIAYVIYTSGSTGRPKGVQLSYGALTNMILWQREHAESHAGARTLQFTTLNFDVSFQEIFATWCAGGTLVLVGEDVRRDATQLWRYLGERAIERLFLPAVALHQLAEVAEDESSAPTSLHEIITAGEQLRITPPLKRLLNRLPNCTLENQYGPTESHVATAYALTGPPAQWPALPPVGRPVDNAQIYLLDAQLQPVPSGVGGELYIAGNGLARGYLNRPDLTAERFIPNRFAARQGERLYKTGDLGRWRVDANVEFLGRNDSQVKIRGYRVELAEVETTVLEHSGVQDAIVIAFSDGNNKKLVAYVVGHGASPPSAEDLREFVKHKLPEYMCPSAFIRMAALPLTLSGKVNRRALPPPDLINPLAENGYVAPRTATEASLAEIWQTVLKLPQVGIDDNFFSLGGHSLVATQVMSRLRAAFDIELPVRHLFEAPTVAGLATLVETELASRSETAQAGRNEREKAMSDDLAKKQALLAEKQALLARLAELESSLQNEDTTPAENEAAKAGAQPTTAAAAEPSARFIPRRPDRRRAPLSFAQQRLWFLYQFDPESSAYNMPTAIRLRGALQVAALERSLNEILRRHDALRTTFEVLDNEPVQIIAPSLVLKLAVEPLDQLSESEREAEALRLAEAAARQPFDLANGPLFRASLLKLGPQDHVLLAAMHHIVSDGWSMGVMVSELTALYEAYAQGKDSPLEPLPIQYADFAAWQRQWLSGDILEAQLSYWKTQLASVPTLINLPTDRPRPVRQSFRGADVQLLVARPIAEALNALSQRQGVTLFMTLLAAYQTLLARYTQQEDIVVGIPIANRNRKEVEGLIGFFVNSLVMRTSLSGAPTFIELLARVREVALGAYAHQDMPFEMLLEAMHLERTISHNPLFQAVFSMLNTPSEALELPGLSLDVFGGETETEKFDLTLRIIEAEAGLQVSLGYNTDIFDAARIRRMADHFKNLLASIVANPESRVSQLSLMDEEEKRQVLDEWNPTTRYPITQTLHERFAEQASKRPDAVAVTSGSQQVSYGELNRRANQLGNYLRKGGVKAEAVVGVMVERGVEMIVGLLGVMKAGGAYLPIDLGSPWERVRGMLEDAGVKVVVAQGKASEGMKGEMEEAGMKVVEMEEERREVEREEEREVMSEAAAENLAYVIYTSGSTGRPKGVGVTHANVGRLFAATAEKFGFSEREVWSVFHGLAFDFSVWEMWGGLMYGGRLVVVSEEERRAPERWYELVEKERVTVMNQTPTAFYQWAREEEERGGGRELGLRVVILGGEELEVSKLKGWMERRGEERVEIVNMYGITETTVHVSYHRVREEEVRRGKRGLIGVGVGDMRMMIMDEKQEGVGVGMRGEICVAGGGLGRGYVGRGGETGRVYVPNPYGKEEGERMYRSGDEGRREEEGEVRYEGRRDGQVKVRGYRVEVGEVERAMMEEEGVREVVVVRREDEAGDARLVAYLVTSQSTRPSQDELRSLLRKRLPEHMLPSAFVFIDKIPLTPNGKVDQRALPAPGSARPNLKENYRAPQNALEKLLAGLWQEVLGLDRVGTHDDFFMLGGDSIKGAVLINRLQAILGEIVHVVAIFNAPTITRLSTYLSEHYANAIARLLDNRDPSFGEVNSKQVIRESETLGTADVIEMRRLIKPLASRRASESAASKNPQAIFVLAPPRSGTTLLRVMMGGHPQLFAPPELELMSFNTLAERRAAFTGKNSFWREGVIRAIMQIKNCDADRAKAIMEDCEDRMTTRQFYHLLQEWIGARRLVDKTPSYALDQAILERMEMDFENPLYVHLLRHPAGMIQSFDEYKLDQLFFQHEHHFSRRQLAELIWLVSHQNITEFLRQIPPSRQHTIKFEDLLNAPHDAMKRLCDFLGLDLHPGMLKPYEDRAGKMVDGLHAESRILGDMKFNTYRGIEPLVGDRWKGAIVEESLSPLTREMAESLGYPMRRGNAQSVIPAVATLDAAAWQDRPPALLIQKGDQEPPFFCAHPVGGGAAHYAHLARALGTERAFYGLQGLDPNEPFIELEERAARLVRAVREIQPRGPYLLGGWSFGGLVAFEMAQQLRDRGEPVALLALLDPMQPRGEEGRVLPANSEAEDLAGVIRQIGELVSRRYDDLPEAIDHLGGEAQPESVYQRLRESQILPPELGPAEMLGWLRALKDKLHTAFKYKPRPYAGKITLFRPEEQFQQHLKAQGSFLGLDLTGVWSRLSSEPIAVHIVPGSHHTMVVQPHVDVLAAKLAAYIREAVNSNFSKAML